MYVGMLNMIRGLEVLICIKTLRLIREIQDQNFEGAVKEVRHTPKRASRQLTPDDNRTDSPFRRQTRCSQLR